MQEILFRGFHKQEDGPDAVIIDDVPERGRWVYGYYCKAEKHFHSGDEHFIIEYSCDGSQYHVEPSTVGQCTGLTGKNRKKIFSGDRVQARMYLGIGNENALMTGVVEFDHAAFHVTWDDCVYGRSFAGYIDGLEVTGTIFDVPQEDP